MTTTASAEQEPERRRWRPRRARRRRGTSALSIRSVESSFPLVLYMSYRGCRPSGLLDVMLSECSGFVAGPSHFFSPFPKGTISISSFFQFPSVIPFPINKTLSFFQSCPQWSVNSVWRPRHTSYLGTIRLARGLSPAHAHLCGTQVHTRVIGPGIAAV